MDIFVIAALISALVIVCLSIFIYRATNTQGSNARPRPAGQREGGAGRMQILRNQRVRMRANARNQQMLIEEEPHELEQEEGENEPQTSRPVEFEDKMGTKKRAKLEAKAERRAAREAEEHLREERKKKEKIQEEERKKREEKEKEEERKHEEEEKRILEEREKKEQEEYEAMKAAFSVEGEGFEENETEQENLLETFIEYIKNNKVVLLEDLAAHFKLKTQAVIERINSLQANGTLTGVLDDRGKFIYISQKELEDVARFIKQRGRVSITDLAESSNQLINLNPVTASS